MAFRCRFDDMHDVILMVTHALALRECVTDELTVTISRHIAHV